MRHARAIGISLACNTQINRLSLPDAPALLELLGDIGARAWQYPLTVPMGRAGCTWTSEVTFGRPGNNPFCHHRALELRARGIRERLVRVEEAPGLPFDKGRFELVEEQWPAGGG